MRSYYGLCTARVPFLHISRQGPLFYCLRGGNQINPNVEHFRLSETVLIKAAFKNFKYISRLRANCSLSCFFLCLSPCLKYNFLFYKILLSFFSNNCFYFMCLIPQSVCSVLLDNHVYNHRQTCFQDAGDYNKNYLKQTQGKNGLKQK